MGRSEKLGKGQNWERNITLGFSSNAFGFCLNVSAFYLFTRETAKEKTDLSGYTNERWRKFAVGDRP